MRSDANLRRNECQPLPGFGSRPASFSARCHQTYARVPPRHAEGSLRRGQHRSVADSGAPLPRFFECGDRLGRDRRPVLVSGPCRSHQTRSVPQNRGRRSRTGCSRRPSARRRVSRAASWLHPMGDMPPRQSLTSSSSISSSQAEIRALVGMPPEEAPPDPSFRYDLSILRQPRDNADPAALRHEELWSRLVPEVVSAEQSLLLNLGDLHLKARQPDRVGGAVTPPSETGRPWQSSRTSTAGAERHNQPRGQVSNFLGVTSAPAVLAAASKRRSNRLPAGIDGAGATPEGSGAVV